MTNNIKSKKVTKRWTNANPRNFLPGMRSGGIEITDIAILHSKILVLWPHFEDQVISIFQRLLGLSPQNFDTARIIFYSLVSQKSRIDVMRRLLVQSHHNMNKSDKYDTILDEFKKLNDSRNKYVHGLWWTHENGEVYLQIDNSMILTHAEYRKVTLKELHDFISRMSTLWNKMLRL